MSKNQDFLAQVCKHLEENKYI